MKSTMLSCCLIVSLAAPASAEPPWPDELDIDLNFRNSARMSDDRHWDIRLGIGAEIEPTYQGSDRSSTEADAVIVLAYRADWGNIFLSGDGLGYSKLLTDNLAIAVQLEAEDTREIEDDTRLAGLGNQDEELELEISGRYFLGPFSIGASVAPATGDKGVVWFVGANYTWRAADDRLFATIGADLSGSSQDNQQTDFGITAAQSTVSGFPVYSPSGGLKSFGINVNAEYALSERWFLYSTVDFERLLGDVADSPIVFDRNALEAGIGVLYRF